MWKNKLFILLSLICSVLNIYGNSNINNNVNDNDNIFIDFVDEKYKEDDERANYYLILDKYAFVHDKYSLLANNIDELNEDYIISSKIFSLDVDDSLESFNRRMYSFNTEVDRKIVFPATVIYKKIVPKPVRLGISNFYDNFKEIPTFVNSVLQLKPKKAVNSLGRFSLNSTLGLVGILDIANEIGLKKDWETMGETLGVYGVKSGSYLILPVLGPSNVRDSIGLVVDTTLESTIRNSIFEKPALYKKGIKKIPYENTRTVATGLNMSSYLNFRYGDFNSPFEYDLVKIFYSNFVKMKERK